MTDTPYEPTLEDIYARGTIYLRPPNKYGFKLNVNHPMIKPYYEQYKGEINWPLWCPLDDAQRRRFEYLVLCSYYPIRLQRRKK